MCAWEELEYDTLPNRILKTTLVRLAGGALSPRAHAAVRDVLRWLSPVSTIDLRGTHFRRVQLHRNNRIYAFLLHVCEFVHEHWLPDAAGGPSRFRDFAARRLPALFEKFVFNFFAHELPPGWTTSAPHIEWPMSEANADARALVPRMMTDVCMSGPGRAIILDTKFYATALPETPGAPTSCAGHLYHYSRICGTARTSRVGSRRKACCFILGSNATSRRVHHPWPPHPGADPESSPALAAHRTRPSCHRRRRAAVMGGRGHAGRVPFPSRELGTCGSMERTPR